MSETVQSEEQATGRERDRVFLVVVDETEELKVALRFACLRARKTGGRIALLYVIEPGEYEHWMAVKELMQEEQREQAEQVLHRLSGVVNELTGRMPELYVREGKPAEALIKLIDEEPAISVLVLGAGTGSEGPGPLVSYIVGRMSGRLRVPITVVPGALSDDDLADLT